MKINVSQQLKAPIGARRSYQVSDIVNIAGSNVLVQGEVRLTRTEQGILAEGTLYTEFEFTCSRCLILFNCPLTLNIEEEYSPTTEVVSGASLPLPEEPGSFTIDEYHTLDLTEAVRQYTLLATPMKPLCCEDCAGLCPECGYNLNQGPCNCPTQVADSRWSQLAKLASSNKDVSNK